MKRSVIGVLIAVLGVFGLFALCLLEPDPVKIAYERLFPQPGARLLQPLSAWEAAIGPATPVPLQQHEPIYFVWPDRGIAVCTHASYQAQRFRPVRDRVVTHILLALKPSLHLPGEDIVVRFSRVPELVVQGTPLERVTAEQLDDLYRFSWRGLPGGVDFTNCPIRLLFNGFVRLTMVDGKPEWLSLEHVSILANYD